MWRISRLEAIPVELDFTSSGGSRLASNAIHAGDVRLINALDLVEFDPSGTQVHVCSCCGVSQCEPSSRVASHIEFWLDLPGVPAWRAFGRTDTGVVMVVDDLVIAPAG